MDATSVRSAMVTEIQIGSSLFSFVTVLLVLGRFPVVTADTKDVPAAAPLFSCRGRSAGYYADVHSGCQKYYMCDAGGRLYNYSCPNRTLFQQRVMICDHWFMVDCSLSENYFGSNLHIGVKGKPFLEGNEEAYRITPEKTSFNRLQAAPYQRSEASTTPYRRNEEARISPYRRYLASTTARRHQSTTSTTPRYQSTTSTTPRYLTSTSTTPRYLKSTSTTPRYQSTTTTTTPRYLTSTSTTPRYQSTTTTPRYLTSTSTTPRYQSTTTTTPRYLTSSTIYPWQQSSPKAIPQAIYNLSESKSQFGNERPPSQILPKTRDDGKYIHFNSENAKNTDDGKYRVSSDNKENGQFLNPVVKTGGDNTLPKAFANNPFFNSYTTSSSEAPLLITNKGQSHLLTSPIPLRKDHQNVFDKNQPAVNNGPTFTSTSTTTTLRTTTATSPLSNKYYNGENKFSTPRREELHNALPNNQFTQTTEAPLNSFVAPQGHSSQRHKESPELRNIFSIQYTPSVLSSESPLTTQKAFFDVRQRLQNDKTIVNIPRVEELGVDGSHDHETEEDLFSNTVEVRIPDTRHMFFIADNPTRQAEMLSIHNETVLTISLPSTSSKHHGAMKFKGSRNSKGRRDDCPQCHPAFLLPGKCQPCVLIR